MARLGVLMFVAAIPCFTISAFAADTQQSSGQWRASKLAGIAIYGPQNQNVGKVSDIIMSKDGKAESVIIGVGGFLGIGEKDVAVPFDHVRFTEQPMMPPANPVPANNLAVAAPSSAAPGEAVTTSPVGRMTASSGVAPGTPVGLGTPSDTLGDGSAAAPGGGGMPVHSTAYPDHGTIDMTADQLKAAPAFQFAK